MTTKALAGAKVLIADDEENHADTISETLLQNGYKTFVAYSPTEAKRIINEENIDLVITDIVFPASEDGDGFEIMRYAKKLHPDCEVIIMTAYASIESAVDAVKMGAFNYLRKPIDLTALRVQVRKALEHANTLRDNRELRKQLSFKYGFEGIIGTSPEMHKAFKVLQQVAPTDVTVLIEGESGTGKELFARAIHYNSPRRNNRFVPLNCAALSEGVLESELFGHEKGAFTNAFYQHKGRFEFANNGTLFLDEIGDMPLALQAKLLRVIEEGAVYRVGNNEPIKVNVRLISATHRNLAEMVDKKLFREDLYYRLKVVTIHLPPLRRRISDIPLLVETFIKEANKTYDRNVRRITKRALNMLSKYKWPGNVRELKNCLESMVITDGDSIIDIDDIPEYITQKKESTADLSVLAGISLEQAEKFLIKNTLEMVNNNREKAAKILGIGERTLYRKIKKYNL